MFKNNILLLFGLALVANTSRATTSYFTSNNCAETNITLPANATNGIIFKLNSTSNVNELVYEDFISELGPGTTTTAGEYYMHHGDVSNECGLW